MAISYPVIGHWYSMPDGALFKVVALDPMDHSIEIQYFDGTVEELESRNGEKVFCHVSSPAPRTG